MSVYFSLLAAWVIVAAIGLPSTSTRRGAFFSVFAGATLFIVTAIRAPSVGTDLIVYRAEYLVGSTREGEPGFSLLMNACRSAGMPFQGFVGVVALILTVTVTVFFFRYSAIPVLSFYLYVTVGLFAMSLTGLRQSLAVAFTVLAFMALMRSRYVAFLLLVGVAFTFHNSALIFAPVILLRWIRLTRKSGLIVLGLVGLLAIPFALGSSEIISDVTSLLGFNRYEVYFTTEYPTEPLVVVVAGLIPLASLLLWPARGHPPLNVQGGGKDDEGLSSMVLMLSIVNFAVVALGLSVPMVVRLSFYFSMYNAILIPLVIAAYPNRQVRHLSVFLCLVLPFIQFVLTIPNSFYGIDDYLPFWW